jgi:hypothetical protein
MIGKERERQQRGPILRNRVTTSAGALLGKREHRGQQPCYRDFTLRIPRQLDQALVVGVQSNVLSRGHEGSTEPVKRPWIDAVADQQTSSPQRDMLDPVHLQEFVDVYAVTGGDGAQDRKRHLLWQRKIADAQPLDDRQAGGFAKLEPNVQPEPTGCREAGLAKQTPGSNLDPGTSPQYTTCGVVSGESDVALEERYGTSLAQRRIARIVLASNCNDALYVRGSDIASSRDHRVAVHGKPDRRHGDRGGQGQAHGGGGDQPLEGPHASESARTAFTRTRGGSAHGDQNVEARLDFADRVVHGVASTFAYSVFRQPSVRSESEGRLG